MINSFTGKYRFLSNFYPAVIEDGGIEYSSVEHAYQAAKTNDLNQKLTIARCKAAGDAKRAGRRVQIRADWNAIKLEVMRELLLKKFRQPDLLEKLLATGEQELIEGNWWGDRYWGVCDGVGQNHLGKLLMEIRSLLIQQEPPLPAAPVASLP